MLVFIQNIFIITDQALIFRFYLVLYSQYTLILLQNCRNRRAREPDDFLGLQIRPMAIPSKHCIVGPMLARCSCQHLLTSAPTRQPMLGRCGFAPKSSVQPTLAFCSGPTSEPASANNGGIMFPTSARSWQSEANQHRNCS